MSDKNRNMNDINDQKTAEQQAFSEEIRRRLAEPGSGKPTLDEFKVMVYKDREKRRKKRNALVACIVAAFIVGYLTYDDLVPEVGADKNPKETIQTEDGIIIEDGGWGSSVGEGEKTVVTDWEEIKTTQKAFPQLMKPKYMSEGYRFDSLEIEDLQQKDLFSKYIFINEKQELLEIEIIVIEGGSITSNVDNFNREIRYKDRTIFCQEGNRKAIIHFDDGTVVSIWHNLPEKELIKIAKSIE